mgnify:CR=1 FL=1
MAKAFTETYRRILGEGRRTLRLYFHSYGDTLPEELCLAHDQQIEAIATTYDLLNRSRGTGAVDFRAIVPELCRNVAHSHGELVSRGTGTFIIRRKGA